MLAPSFYKFGIGLGLPPQELDKIRKENPQDMDQALTEVLLVWLRQRYSVGKHGPPTWRKLVEAVDNRVGGNNHALAKTIASNHPTGIYIPSFTSCL